MWIVFSFFLVFWVLSIHFYLPVLCILALFACVLLTAGLALIPSRQLE